MASVKVKVNTLQRLEKSVLTLNIKNNLKRLFVKYGQNSTKTIGEEV